MNCFIKYYDWERARLKIQGLEKSKMNADLSFRASSQEKQRISKADESDGSLR